MTPTGENKILGSDLCSFSIKRRLTKKTSGTKKKQLEHLLCKAKKNHSVPCVYAIVVSNMKVVLG